MKIKPSKKLWRTLLRVHKVCGNSVEVIIPGWDVNKPVKIPIEFIPKDKRYLLKEIEDYKFHAQVNIGADNKKDLIFENFEMHHTPFRLWHIYKIANYAIEELLRYWLCLETELKVAKFLDLSGRINDISLMPNFEDLGEANKKELQDMMINCDKDVKDRIKLKINNLVV